MNSSDAHIIGKPLPENERAALIKLLGDDDPVTYPVIRRKIISHGPAACEWLRPHLPSVGIGLPGHFLCRYQSTSDEVFIDAFDRGKLMTKADCVQYLVRGNYDL